MKTCACTSGQRTHDFDRQFEIFSLDKDVVKGEKYYIEMNFTGPLTGDLAGFYLSKYQRGNNTMYDIFLKLLYTVSL